MSQESFRMVIDDTFLIKGRGTVVTGIVESGAVKKGDKVTLLSAENKALITSVVSGIEMPNPENLTEEFLNSQNVGILIYSEKFHAMAKKGMYLISASTYPNSK
jgi:elongation factor Tu